jgi:hypothetical protein
MEHSCINLCKGHVSRFAFYIKPAHRKSPIFRTQHNPKYWPMIRLFAVDLRDYEGIPATHRPPTYSDPVKRPGAFQVHRNGVSSAVILVDANSDDQERDKGPQPLSDNLGNKDLRGIRDEKPQDCHLRSGPLACILHVRKNFQWCSVLF